MKNQTQTPSPINIISPNTQNHTCSLKAFCSVMSDESVIECIKKDKENFSCIVDRYDQKIKRYIKRIGGESSETNEDIAQEVFVKTYLNLDKFDQSMKFSSWIYRIAHNETINYWRKNKRKNESSVSWDENETLKSIIRDERDVEDEVYRDISSEKLLEIIDKIDEKYRSVIMLNYLEDKSYKEIADVIKKPIGTVGTMLNRAKKILKKELVKSGNTVLVSGKYSASI